MGELRSAMRGLAAETTAIRWWLVEQRHARWHQSADDTATSANQLTCTMQQFPHRTTRLHQSQSVHPTLGPISPNERDHAHSVLPETRCDLGSRETCRSMPWAWSGMCRNLCLHRRGTVLTRLSAPFPRASAHRQVPSCALQPLEMPQMPQSAGCGRIIAARHGRSAAPRTAEDRDRSGSPCPGLHAGCRISQDRNSL